MARGTRGSPQPSRWKVTGPGIQLAVSGWEILNRSNERMNIQTNIAAILLFRLGCANAIVPRVT